MYRLSLAVLWGLGLSALIPLLLRGPVWIAMPAAFLLFPGGFIAAIFFHSDSPFIVMASNAFVYSGLSYVFLAGKRDISARFLRHLQDLQTTSQHILLSGVGGGADSMTVETAIAFARDDGELVTVRGAFGVFTQSESADLSILGRDVTNNFTVIYDYPQRIIALLAPPHSCEIKSSA